MSLYSWIAALIVILATARAQSGPELRPNGYAMPLSAAQCDCRTIQSKLDQQDQRVSEMFKQQEKKTESILNGLLTKMGQMVEQRLMQMFDKLQHGHSTELDQQKHRVAEKLDRNQNITASILDGLFTKLEHLEHRISQLFDQRYNKTEAVLNGHESKLDQLLEDRVSRMLERQQNGTEAIPKDVKQVIENDEDKIVAQQNLTHQSAVNDSKCQYVETQFGPNWIVIMERIDDSGNFARPWKDYRDGFGTVGQHFWLGLEKMHQLTKGSPYELAVEITSHKNGEQRYARYDSFEIGSEEQEYPLVKLGTFSGSAGDALIDGSISHKSASFSTFDSGKHIARSKDNGNGGWWFPVGGWYSYLTGARRSLGMLWGPVRLSSARMMIRAI